MHEHECAVCGKTFENMLWIDTICCECEQEMSNYCILERNLALI